MRYELTEYEWTAIRPFLSNKPRAVPRVDYRRVLNGIFWILRSRAMARSAGEHWAQGNGRNRWSETHTHLYHVKQAWRIDTMHPKQTYTRSEARAILDAVNVFMNDLATLVSE